MNTFLYHGTALLAIFSMASLGMEYSMYFWILHISIQVNKLENKT